MDTPPSPAEALSGALRLLHDGAEAEVKALCAAILRDHPNHAGALHLRGIAEGIAAPDAAVGFLASAIDAFPFHPDACRDLGDALRRLGRLGEAADAYRRALDLKADWEEAHERLAGVLDVLESPADAAALRAAADVMTRSARRADEAARRRDGRSGMDVTVVIPTRDRQAFLARALAYYAGFGLPVVVADSSAAPFAGVLPPGVLYRHYPGALFAEQLSRALADVVTPYAVLSPDDDFIVPGAALQCVEFLKEHPGYVSACGQYLFFTEDDDSPSGFWGYAPRRNWHVEADTPQERLRFVMANYMQQLYAVHETRTLRLAFDSMGRYGGHTDLWEIMVGLASAIRGKHRTLPMFYAMRQILENSTAITTGVHGFGRLDPGGPDGTEFPRVIGNLGVGMARALGITMEKALAILHGAIALYPEPSPMPQTVAARYHRRTFLFHDLVTLPETGPFSAWNSLELRQLAEIVASIRHHRCAAPHGAESRRGF